MQRSERSPSANMRFLLRASVRKDDKNKVLLPDILVTVLIMLWE